MIIATVIPYQDPIAKDSGPDVSSTMSQTLPMAAIFLRNRYIGWYEHDLLLFPRSRRAIEASTGIFGADTCLAMIGLHVAGLALKICDGIQELIHVTTGPPSSSAYKTGLVRANTIRRTPAHLAISPLAWRSCPWLSHTCPCFCRPRLEARGCPQARKQQRL